MMKEVCMARGGWTALPRKICKIALLPLAFLGVVAVRLLSHVLLIRFGALNSTRIGHFALSTELYLCKRDTSAVDGHVYDVFYAREPVCNLQLKKMLDRVLPVFSFISLLDRINRLIPGWEKYVVRYDNNDRDIYGLFARTKPHLYFTRAEEHLGLHRLRELNIPEGMPFICFYVRDSAYMESKFPGADWSYHDYRDSSIYNCLSAVDELARRGFFMIRMGAVVKERLKTTNPMIIDYASNDRDDFMDIFLGSKCHFFISAAAGLAAIPAVFRKPIAWINFIPLEHVPGWSANDIFIPKKLWLRKERRFLTFREIIDSGAGRFLEGGLYEENGIEAVENSPEEITALALEMEGRLSGKWQGSLEDEDLQGRFRSLFKPNDLNREFVVRISAEFLRNNRQLLE